MTIGSSPLTPAKGRQLFVDDALIERHSCRRVFHAATVRPEPVLRPETPLEMNGGECPAAAPFNDGVWYDPAGQRFCMYYQAGWFAGVAVAFSRDGLHWTRPVLDVVPGTNLVLPIRKRHYRDGCMVWLDLQAEVPSERWKMFLYSRVAEGEQVRDQFGELYVSADGIHWTFLRKTTPCGDNSSFFYNAVRNRWAFSVRRGGMKGRFRTYVEAERFSEAGTWDRGRERLWCRADDMDLPDPAIDFEPQIYDVNAVGYESLLLGAVTVMYGPENPECAARGIPKTIDLQLAYSRNGLDWDRPCREAFIPCSRREGHWARAYIHAAGGLCCIMDDELYFYFTAFSGVSPKLSGNQTGSYITANAMYAGASTGLATLRRDGFASMEAGEEEAELLTRLLRLPDRFFFVNVDAEGGSCRLELRDEQDRPIQGFTLSESVAAVSDSTRLRMVWKQQDTLSALTGRPVKLLFRLQRCRVFSFWTSADASGHSGGFTAAGGPGISGVRDRRVPETCAGGS